MHIFIVTNSPGELAGWVRPVARSLKRKNPEVKVIVVTAPCQYASGREKKFAKDLPEVDYVMGRLEYLKFVLLGLRPSLLELDAPLKGAVLFLGGDPVHSLLLSRRLGLPAFSYTHRPRYKKYFKKFMVVDEKMRKKFIEEGVSSDKVVVVGDLVADAVEDIMPKEKIYTSLQVNPASLCISLFPGSRPQIVRYMSPFFLRVAELVKEEFAEACFLLVLSPFIPRRELTSLTEEELNKIFQVRQATLKRKEGGWELITASGLEVLVVEENRYEAMSMSTIAITIPGTNTHELSLLGVPMVVAVPLNKPEAIPFDGLAGLMGNLPVVGSSIKRWMVKRYNSKVKFTAIPNRWAGKSIVPEVRGKLEPEGVAEKAVKLLREPERLRQISHELKGLFPRAGSADRLAEAILNN